MDNILPILTLIFLIFLIYHQKCKIDKFTQTSTDSANRNKIEITESIKNLGILVNEIVKNDKLVLPSNIYAPNAKKTIFEEDFIFEKNIYLNSDYYLPPGTITSYFNENLITTSVNEKNETVITFDIPIGWVLCDGNYYKKAEYLNHGEKNIPRNQSWMDINSYAKNKYFKTVNLMDKMIIGCNIPGVDADNNDYMLGLASSSLKSFENAPGLKEEGGQNMILINDNHMPSHYHKVAGNSQNYPGNIYNYDTNTTDKEKYLARMQIYHSSRWSSIFAKDTNKNPESNMIGGTSGANIDNQQDSSVSINYQQERFNNMPKHVKLVWIQKI